MKTFTYTITDNAGIHARPAGLLSKAASEFKSSVKICLNGKEAEAGRLFAIMGLNVKHGNTVEIKISGEDEDAAAVAMEKFFKENL